jgi:putative peptidoglycan lipid II flippase
MGQAGGGTAQTRRRSIEPSHIAACSRLSRETVGGSPSAQRARDRARRDMTLIRHLFARVFPRGAITLSVLMLGYYGLGLIRNRVQSATFGAGVDFEAYVAAFRIPEIAFDVVVAAGLAAPFVPIYTGLRERETDGDAADRFGQTVLTAAVLVVAIIALVLAIIAPVTVEWLAPSFDDRARALYVDLFRLSCISQLFFAGSFVIGEVLVAHRRFLPYALAPLCYTGGSIAGTVLLGHSLGITGTALGAVAGAAAHLIVRLAGLPWTPFRPRPRLGLRMPAFREFVRLMIPRMASAPIDPLTVALFTRAATGIGVGALTAYNYASDYQVVPVSLIGASFSLAVFPTLATAWNDGDGPAFRAVLRRNLVTITGLTVVAALALAVLAHPIIDRIHGSGAFGPGDVDRTALVLALFALSVPLDSLAYPLSRALYASHNTALQVAASLAGFGTIAVAAAALSGPVGIAAIPLAYALGTGVKALLLAVFVRRRLRLLDGVVSPARSSE